MKQIPTKLTILTAFVVLGGISLWLGGNPSRHARQIVPGISFETVVKILGSPEAEKEKEGMTVCYFKPNFYAAGPIRVGFDSQKKTVYLKIWEDTPPQWDLRKTNGANQRLERTGVPPAAQP